jgi:hypothetical protein
MELLIMVDKNTRNCNIVKKISDIFIVIVGETLSQFISKNFFNDSIWHNLIILIVFLLVMTPVKLYIDNNIDRYFLNKENK